MQRFKDILRSGSRPEWIVLLVGSLLMTIYLYQAQPTFFHHHVGPLLTGGAGTDSASGPLQSLFGRLWEYALIFLLWAVIPAILSRRALGLRLRDQGVALGDARFGWRAVAVALPLLVPVLYLTSLDPEFQHEYPLSSFAGLGLGAFVLWEAARAVYYIAWEYFFRGFMLFGLRGRLGDFGAIAVQTAVTTIIHIGKPEGEMLSALVAGVLLGALALRTRSVVYGLALHWAVGLGIDAFCLLQR